MRYTLFALALITLAGCSSQNVVHYSPYDLNRDGVMDAKCPGMTYDTQRYRHYSWKSRASQECREQSQG
jgi:hypothetical protein